MSTFFTHVARKLRSRQALCTQILFVALAFVAMVTLSYAFMNNLVHGNLIHNAESVLDVTEMRISSRLSQFETTMKSFRSEVEELVEEEIDPVALENYFENISHFTFLDGNDTSGIQGFYGYFKTIEENPLLITGNYQALLQDSRPEESDWWRQALEAEDASIETIPAIAQTGERSYTYVQSLLDDQGNLLGVLCMDVEIDDLGQEVVLTALNQGGYGMLLNQDLIMMFHPNTSFEGLPLDNPLIPVYRFADDLRGGREVFEQTLVSYKNEASLAFFREMSNGWYLGLVTPEDQYYASMNTMTTTILLLGLSLAAILIAILIRIDTARTKSEDENKKKSVFLANMSHEIRTPLNAVIGLSELALSHTKLENDTEDKLEKIHTSGITILSIVNDILDISKLESGRFEILPTQYDTPSLINDIATLNSIRVGEKPLVFIIEVDEELPSVLYGDDLRIKQIFNNLLSNALKYTLAGSVKWRISFERDGDTVWLTSSIQDTGRGIRPEDLPRLFSDYTQVDRGANRTTEGTGLGLAITKQLVELMDGSIGVESEFGKGSVFKLRLRQGFVSDAPIGKEVSRNIKEMRYTVSRRNRNLKLHRVNLSYATVLVVDDIATNLEVTKGMMLPYELKVECASSGEQAIEMIRAEKPRYTAVFMDHMMPGIDGIEATRIIREEIGSDYARTVPIIALTANALVGSEEMFLTQGFQDFISKPLDTVKLDAILRLWVRDKKRERSGAGDAGEDVGEDSGSDADGN